MPRTYWYFWWAGAAAYLVMGTLATISAVDVAVTSQVFLKGWMTWLFLTALGAMTIGRRALRSITFYWSLACLVLAAALPVFARQVPDLDPAVTASVIMAVLGIALALIVKVRITRKD